MKGQKSPGRQHLPPAIALAALLLALVTAITTPLAMAKYTAAGAHTASGQVAKWGVNFPEGTAAASVRMNNAYVFYDAGNIGNGVTTSKTASVTHTFIVKNESQVAADIKLQAFYIVVDTVDHITGGKPDETSAATGYVIAHNTTNTGTVTAQSGNNTGVATYRFSPGAQAVFNLTITRHSTVTTTRAVRLVAVATQVD